MGNETPWRVCVLARAFFYWGEFTSVDSLKQAQQRELVTTRRNGCQNQE